MTYIYGVYDKGYCELLHSFYRTYAGAYNHVRRNNMRDRGTSYGDCRVMKVPLR